MILFQTSELSPATHTHMAQAFIDAGLPDGVLNVIHSRFEDSAEVVDSLITSPEIRKINFTGSTTLGKKLAVAAAENLKPILLELGGKGAVLVLEDADLSEAAAQIVSGAWMNQGQICMSTERVFVQRDIYDEFIASLRTAAKNLRGVFGGFPQAQERYATKVYGLIKDAIDEGAESVFGELKISNGLTLEPTILANVNPESAIYSQETFGPTMIVIPVDSVEEMIAQTNASDYGLTVALWTEDIVRGLKIAREIQSGAVHINGNVSVSFLFYF